MNPVLHGVADYMREQDAAAPRIIDILREFVLLETMCDDDGCPLRSVAHAILHVSHDLVTKSNDLLAAARISVRLGTGKSFLITIREQVGWPANTWRLTAEVRS